MALLRKDLKLGFLAGGLLLAIAVAYVLVLTFSGSDPGPTAAHGDPIDTDPPSVENDTGPDSPPPVESQDPSAPTGEPQTAAGTPDDEWSIHGFNGQPPAVTRLPTPGTSQPEAALPDAPFEDAIPPGPNLNEPKIVLPDASAEAQGAPAGATAPPTGASGLRTHVVASGDNFSTLAAKYYGDASLFGLIQKANPGVDPRRMKVGQSLVIPERPATSAGSPAMQSSPIAGPDEHIVAAGETLAKIAQDRLGAELRWEELYKLNRDVIGADPARLKVGMRLKLPK